MSVDTETFKKVLDKSKPNPRLNSFKEIASALKMEEKPKIFRTRTGQEVDLVGNNFSLFKTVT